LSGDLQFGCCGLGGHGFDTRGCFFLGLPSSRLRGFCRFGFRLLRLGDLPGGGHFRLLWHLRGRLRRGIWIWEWSGVGLDHTPYPGRRDFTHHLSSSARQGARPAELSERQGGLWQLSFRHVRAPAFQQPPSLIST
jgi:hypothetical protein